MTYRSIPRTIWFIASLFLMRFLLILTSRSLGIGVDDTIFSRDVFWGNMVTLISLLAGILLGYKHIRLIVIIVAIAELFMTLFHVFLIPKAFFSADPDDELGVFSVVMHDSFMNMATQFLPLLIWWGLILMLFSTPDGRENIDVDDQL